MKRALRKVDQLLEQTKMGKIYGFIACLLVILILLVVVSFYI